MGPPSSCAGFSLANYFGVCTSQIAAWCIWLAFFDSWRAGANDFCQEGFFCVWIRWSFHSWSQMPSIPSHDKLLWHVRHCRAGRHLAFSTPYGEVVCLAKVDQPKSVMDYRPITILGLLYRLWGSYHARRAIRALDPILPDTLYGSRTARFAGQVWSQLLWAVEDATVQGIALSGLVADLQKAFNHLPRLVIFEAAALLGVPMRVLCMGWRLVWLGSSISTG